MKNVVMKTIVVLLVLGISFQPLLSRAKMTAEMLSPEIRFTDLNFQEEFAVKYNEQRVNSREVRDLLSKTIIYMPVASEVQVGMGRILYDKHKEIRDLYDEAAEIMGCNLEELFHKGNRKGKFEYYEPICTVLYNISLYKLFLKKVGTDVKILGLTGYCAGFMTNAIVSGAISFEDGIRLFEKQMRAYGELPVPFEFGVMIVSGLSADKLEPYLMDGKVEMSFDNSPNRAILIIEKSVDAISLNEKFQQMGAKVKYYEEPLAITRHMNSNYFRYRNVFKGEVDRIEVKMPSIRIIAGPEGTYLESVEEIRRELIEHFCRPTIWRNTLETVKNEKARAFLCLGFSRRFANNSAIDVPVIVVDKEGDIENAVQEFDTILKKEEDFKSSYMLNFENLGIVDSLKAVLEVLPHSFLSNKIKLSEDKNSMEMELRKVLEQNLQVEGSAFIFSEKIAFDYGLGVLLPKLAKAGVPIAIVATKRKQIKMIDELNKLLPNGNKIQHAISVLDIVGQLSGVARYYYFKVEGDQAVELSGIVICDVTNKIREIVESLGKTCGVEIKLFNKLHNALEKFGQAV